MTIHAPSENRVATTITNTMPVVVAPITLTAAFPSSPAVRRRATPHHAGLREREGHEHADHVELDQPGQVASNTQTAARARPASTATPLENTSRSPRLRNCEGMNRSRARIDASRGKSWYAVFAARIRISAVKICSDDEHQAVAEHGLTDLREHRLRGRR